MEVGGWVGAGLTRFFLENRPKIALNQYCIHTLLKVVGYYDFSGMSISVMGFQKNSLDGGWWVGRALSKFFFYRFLKF